VGVGVQIQVADHARERAAQLLLQMGGDVAVRRVVGEVQGSRSLSDVDDDRVAVEVVAAPEPAVGQGLPGQ